jgi:hypothetical protein
MTKRKKSAPIEDVVGYGRPPKATQFKSGKSGNPKGRPKGSRSVGAILQGIIRHKVSVTENGRTRRISTLEVMLRRLANDAMRSDQKAIKLLLSLADRYAESPESSFQIRELLAEDETILSRYLRDDSTSDPHVQPNEKGPSDDA